MDEYPKVIQIGTLKVTVTSAAEEAHWRTPVVVSEGDSLSHGVSELDTSEDLPPAEPDEAPAAPAKKKATPKKGEKKK